LFVVLEIAAVNYYAHSSYYAQAKILARTDCVIGGVAGAVTDVRGYFRLKSENRCLAERVAALENIVARGVDSIARSSEHRGDFSYMSARVVANSINRNDNYISLDRGARDGVVPDMAVLSPEGAMVGYVVGCSERYSVVLPLLNTSFKTSGKLLRDGNYGSIEWDGRNRYNVRMRDLSKYADIKLNDTIVSTAFSHYFPADVPIGYVESFELNETGTAYEVEIRLAVQMSALHNVILTYNGDLEEVAGLETDVKESMR